MLQCLAWAESAGYIHEMKPLDNSGNKGESAADEHLKKQEINRRIRSYQLQLRRLASELSLAEARERREIASDLHDHIGQALAHVTQKVATLQGNAVFSGMEEYFSEILTILQQTIRYTRALTVEISPPVLYELGLPAAIDWLAERASKRHNLKIASAQSGTPQTVSEDIRVFVFKSLQELITNVAKHAGTDRVEIMTNWLPERIEIIVRDGGRGFDTSTLEIGQSENSCFGLFSIRERLSYIGGTMEIQSAPGQGTRVTITSPYSIHSGEKHD